MNGIENITAIILVFVSGVGGYLIGATAFAYNLRKRLIELGVDKETLNAILSGKKD